MCRASQVVNNPSGVLAKKCQKIVEARKAQRTAAQLRALADAPPAAGTQRSSAPLCLSAGDGGWDQLPAGAASPHGPAHHAGAHPQASKRPGSWLSRLLAPWGSPHRCLGVRPVPSAFAAVWPGPDGELFAQRVAALRPWFPIFRSRASVRRPELFPSHAVGEGMLLPRLGLIIVLGGTVRGAVAHSEPFTANGRIFAADQEAGWLADAPINISSWLSPQRARFTVAVEGNDGVAARVHGVLRLDHSETGLTARVCQETRLSEGGLGSFEISMLPGAEAAVVSRAPRGPLVRVRPPVVNDLDEDHVLPVAALGRDCRLKPTISKSLSKSLQCEPFMLHSRPDPSARSYTIDSAAAVRATARRDGWYRVEVDGFERFRWHGFARQAPKCSEPARGTGSGQLGQSIGPPGPPCWEARLPRGAVLRVANGGFRLLEVTRELEATICGTERPFEWEVKLSIGWGSLGVLGSFDGSPRASTGGEPPVRPFRTSVRSSHARVRVVLCAAAALSCPIGRPQQAPGAAARRRQADRWPLRITGHPHPGPQRGCRGAPEEAAGVARSGTQNGGLKMGPPATGIVRWEGEANSTIGPQQPCPGRGTRSLG